MVLTSANNLLLDFLQTSDQKLNKPQQAVLITQYSVLLQQGKQTETPKY